MTYEELKQEYENSPEYQNQYGLALIKASSAYARGATGEGVLIGIMDSGVDTAHQELNGQNKFSSDSYLTYSSRSPTIEEKRHGTHVSGIAVGERDGSGIHGVAFDAQLFFISIELSDPPPDYQPVTIDSTVDYSAIDSSWSTLESYFVERGVTVVNGSFGYQGNINDYSESNLRYAFPKTISALAQINTPDSGKTIFVWSAGNAGAYSDEGVDFSSPEVFPGMAYLLPELQGHTVAVVSVDNSGAISWFSSRCGVAKDYCIAAPGEEINSAYSSSSSNQYEEFSGTSMAAPHVSGGLALLADYFRDQLGNTELLSRLFSTANKSGIYADSEIYGQGLMDLDAATSPVGSTMVAVSPELSELKHTETSTKINFLPGLIGDSFNSLLEKEYVVFDDLGSPFFKKLNSSYKGAYVPLSYLTNRYSNSSNQTRQIHNNSGEVSYILGINDFSRDFEPESVSLWSKDRERLKYFSLKREFNNKNFIFLGKGIAPASYFGSFKGTSKNLNSFNRENTTSPYLAFTSKGSFMGFGKSFSSRLSLRAAALLGKHQDSDIFFDPSDNSGLVLEIKSLKNKINYSLQSGFISESNSLMGSSFSGGFGLKESKTYFSGINMSSTFFGFKSIGSIFYGTSKPKVSSDGILKNFEKMSSSSFSLELFKENYFLNNDSLGIKISQPLRLDSGRADFHLPVGRTKEREVLFEDFTYHLSPSGRQLDLELVYSGHNKRFGFNTRLGVSKDYRHISEENSFFIEGNIVFNLY
ncbi:MAG: S8 family peptidase [Gammaproteobacteria bacterium]